MLGSKHYTCEPKHWWALLYSLVQDIMFDWRRRKFGLHDFVTLRVRTIERPRPCRRRSRRQGSFDVTRYHYRSLSCHFVKQGAVKHNTLSYVPFRAWSSIILITRAQCIQTKLPFLAPYVRTYERTYVRSPGHEFVATSSYMSWCRRSFKIRWWCRKQVEIEYYFSFKQDTETEMWQRWKLKAAVFTRVFLFHVRLMSFYAKYNDDVLTPVLTFLKINDMTYDVSSSHLHVL